MTGLKLLVLLQEQRGGAIVVVREAWWVQGAHDSEDIRYWAYSAPLFPAAVPSIQGSST